MKTLKALFAIVVIASTAALTGCASKNPYANYGYEVSPRRSQQVQVYAPSPIQQPVRVQSNAGLIPAPIYGAPVQRQQVQQGYPAQQRQGYYNGGYQQQRQQLDPIQKCEMNRDERAAQAQADMQITIQTESGFFVESRARSEYREDMQKIQKRYISCMQNAQRQVVRQQIRQQYQQGYQGGGYYNNGYNY